MVLEELDLRICNARLRRGGETLVDIAIADGRIVAIGEGVGGSARDTIDAEGGLVTESFVNPHLHLCKVWTLPMMSEAALAAYHGAGMGKALGAIDLASAIKAKYDAEWIAPNARRAVGAGGAARRSPHPRLRRRRQQGSPGRGQGADRGAR